MLNMQYMFRIEIPKGDLASKQTTLHIIRVESRQARQIERSRRGPEFDIIITITKPHRYSLYSLV